MSRNAALEALGQQLRHLREGAGVNLTEAARRLECGKSHLSNVELGNDPPSADIVAFYDRHFNGDGYLWRLFVTALMSRPHQRRAPGDKPAAYPIPGYAPMFVEDLTEDGTVRGFNRWLHLRNDAFFHVAFTWLSGDLQEVGEVIRDRLEELEPETDLERIMRSVLLDNIPGQLSD